MAGANVRDIKVRIESVKSTRQITKAMKMISASKLRKAQESIICARPYANTIAQMMGRLARRIPDLAKHPLFVRREQIKSVALVVVTGDRGLCGGFNINVLKSAVKYIESLPQGTEVELFTVGKKARDFFRRRSWPIKSEFLGMNKEITTDFTSGLVTQIAGAYQRGHYDDIRLFYNEFKSVLTQHTRSVQLLPIAPEEVPEVAEADPKCEAQYMIEPSVGAVFERLLPQHISIQLRRAVLESNASEHAARMTAMDAATNNASDMIDKMTLFYNQARQASITAEILDIAGGAEALKG